MIDRIRFFLEKIPVSLLLVIGLAYLMFDYNQYINDPGSELNLKKKDLSDSETTETNLKRKIVEVKEFSKKMISKDGKTVVYYIEKQYGWESKLWPKMLMSSVHPTDKNFVEITIPIQRID